MFSDDKRKFVSLLTGDSTEKQALQTECPQRVAFAKAYEPDRDKSRPLKASLAPLGNVAHKKTTIKVVLNWSGRRDRTLDINLGRLRSTLSYARIARTRY